MHNQTIEIAGQKVFPGTQANIMLPAADLYTQTKMGIPIHVFHGKEAGPRVFITGGIHGDELNSIEILRRVHQQQYLKTIKGTLITIPVVNVYGFILQSRYLPDRRDLNRSFPGSPTGSLAARLAFMLNEKILKLCQYGIDLHTGAIGHANLPQLRVNLATPGAKSLSIAFDVPVIIDAKIRDGSLRQAACEQGIPVLVYEGGEALRANEPAIRMGVRGITNVLNYLGMINVPPVPKRSSLKPLVTRKTQWLRAPVSGLLQAPRDFTQHLAVKKGEILAYIHDPFLINPTQAIVAPYDAIMIGIANLPVINEGDAVCNIARTKNVDKINAYIEEIREEIFKTK